jgi:hypothetical protein
MARYGWAKVEQAEIYTKGADRRRLGIEASDLVAGHVENIIPRTSVPGAGEVGETPAKSRAKK